MCGIAGFWDLTSATSDAEAVLHRMMEAIRHRGPDDSGQWLDPDSGIALGHRRLSILDLSPEGHQPMVSVSGRFILIYNGEIYNFCELRQEEEARGTRFRGHSDTEIMLAVFERYGVVEGTKRLAGMFAFVLWDRVERVMHLGRDRIGEKPLYYALCKGTLLFGSELKSLKVHPAWNGQIDRGSLALYLRYNYVPAPRGIYTELRKLEPATILTVSVAGAMSTTTYWSLTEVVQQGMETPLSGSDDELVDQLEARLRRTIAEEMLADVPLGAFLSGGIDSTTVVALMQAQSQRPVRTFTIGFQDESYNEAQHARAIARHLGTAHTELYVTPEQARAVIPKLPMIYDEPFGDSSEIPTYLVAQMARQHVTVALSGDGGDEMFAGYERYSLGRRFWRALAPIPMWMRRGAGKAIQSVSPSAWEVLLAPAQRGLPLRFRVPLAGDRLHKAARILSVSSPDTMYRTLVSNWDPPSEILLDADEPGTWLSAGPDLPRVSLVERMMLFDSRTYLPDDILVKVDRASMAVSLEARAPFLDHRVVEFVWRLPLRLKLRGGRSKWALRAILDRYVPRALVERRKMGFGVPIDSWLRGPLREWAESLLAPSRLREEGYFDPEMVWCKWQQHQSGTRNRQYPLWNLLMFQAWLSG